MTSLLPVTMYITFLFVHENREMCSLDTFSVMILKTLFSVFCLTELYYWPLIVLIVIIENMKKIKNDKQNTGQIVNPTLVGKTINCFHIKSQ